LPRSQARAPCDGGTAGSLERRELRRPKVEVRKKSEIRDPIEESMWGIGVMVKRLKAKG
jgi:hypothetical protein